MMSVSKKILSKVGLAALSLWGCSPTALAAQEAVVPERPNILLIILDDVGLDMTTDMYPGLVDRLTRQYGPDGLNNPDYEQINGHPASIPVLQNFASQGMVFTNAWAEPFCSPTRAAILTGRSTPKMNVRTYADPLASHHTSFVKLLSDSGYSTPVFGKCHMAGLPGQPMDYPGMKPKQAGFDVFHGGMHAAPVTYWDYEYQTQDAATAPDTWRTEPAPMRSLAGIPATTYAPVVKAADTIDWIATQEASNPDTPWFTWLAFNLAHATISSDPTQMIVPDANTLDDATRAEMELRGGRIGAASPGGCSGEADAVRDPVQDMLATEPINLMAHGTKLVGVRNASHKLVCTGGAEP